ncbi:amphoterin-induced protein 3 [Corapipo altera]|uniref:amphoterin-induced protein 3 n=1 Tax=Corapipo altera TaxID=415028 RepID=UPI000FD6B674|nr:amphoterin-induced protein 3 [Corapipo altera]
MLGRAKAAPGESRGDGDTLSLASHRAWLCCQAAQKLLPATMSPPVTADPLWPRVVKLLLLLLQLCAPGRAPQASPQSRLCPSACICTSDLLSCSRQTLQRVPPALPSTTTTLDLSHNALTQLHDRWLAALPHLEALHISHNQIRDLSPQAFHNASYLRHLDMSSNHLHAVETHYFEALVSLEELLLYNNHIKRVDENAFAKLSGLRKVYLSWNNLTTFPFHAVQGLGIYNLRTLDLSSNCLSSIPVEVLVALPENIGNGLYLHNNPIRCSCPLYLMLQRWKQRGFSSVKDFFEEHTCKVSGNVPRSLIKVHKYSPMFENCLAGPGDAHLSPFQVMVGQPILLTCNTSLPSSATTYMWISPQHEPIKHPGNSNGSLEVFRNGSLRIAEAKPWHSGVYVGFTKSTHNFSRLCEFNVTVQYPKPAGETFNTGLTTLLGCIVTLVLVIIYLYLTPCRCLRCCKKPAPLSPPQECSAQSSILSTTPPATDGPNRRAGANKHVAFLEPIRETQNGKIRLALGEDFPDPKHPKVLQLKSDTESISSVFSDTPIVS